MGAAALERNALIFRHVTQKSMMGCESLQKRDGKIMIFKLLKTGTVWLALVSLPLPLSANVAPAPETVERSVLVVVGAPGTDEYAPIFERWARHWRQAEESGNAEVKMIGLDSPGEKDDRTLIQEWLDRQPKAGDRELWLVFLGHGTFDGQLAKANLRGPDISATELAEWLADFHRPLVIIDCTSCSGPFVNRLSGENRIIITATKSGYEMNYARFGGYFSEAIFDPKADLDRDGQTSLLEAFLSAGARVEEFYESEDRLATEHALLDDNGDGLGTQANWFRGIRPVKKPREGSKIDGLRAHQVHLIPSEQEKRLPLEVRKRRNELELQINDLREQKGDLNTDAYYHRLEPLLIELAHLYESAETSGNAGKVNP